MSNPKIEGREILTIADLSWYKLDTRHSSAILFISFFSFSNRNRKHSKRVKVDVSVINNKCKWFKSFY